MVTTHRTLFSWSKPFPTSFQAVFHAAFGQKFLHWWGSEWVDVPETVDGLIIQQSNRVCSLGEVLGRALFCYTGDALLRSPDCVKSVSALKWNTDGIRYKWSVKDHELIYSSSILSGTKHSNETEILAIKKAVEISADLSSLAQAMDWLFSKRALQMQRAG
ncbi:hypothetical protein NC653_022840 [Populus alba x Populus x berolinensis]|uniref:Uncharacterized protein n=1 Tax=Populus alba x Populus x berolinensis TaxID=444605 RepID=A0AAD6MFN0_9ROSI|nr:hypothetical protein NC653_022840 [Populus alba x Populus x berolinensis]